jgi:hypothetical protein
MIVYRLHCSNGHGFEGWFASGDAFDAQRAAGQVACPSCDDRAVGKLPSAPYVNTGRGGTAGEPAATRAPDPAAAMPVANAMAAVKAFILAHTEDVGRKFPEVARRIHYGEEALRGIRGRVTREEAQSLEDEGVPAVALPPALALGEDVH